MPPKRKPVVLEPKPPTHAGDATDEPLVLLLPPFVAPDGAKDQRHFSSSDQSSPLVRKKVFADFCAEIGVSFENIAFLNGSFVVSDVVDPTEPILFASAEFQALTGYAGMQQKGRKCSFLQGKDTNPADVNDIRALVRSRLEGFVKIINHRADGSPFLNILWLAPLVPISGHTKCYKRYMIGCQCNASEVLSRILVAPTLLSLCRADSKVRLRHVESGVVFRPNVRPMPIRGEHFEGTVWAACIEGTRTKLEIQVQGCFKGSIVETDLVMIASVKDPVTVPPVAKSIIDGIYRLVTPPRAGMSLTSSRPWFSCPLVSMIMEGESFPSSAPFLAGRTYSFSFQSCFLDLEKWELCNLPGIKSIGLRELIGDQTVNVTLSVAGVNTNVMEFEIAHSSLPDQLW